MVPLERIYPSVRLGGWDEIPKSIPKQAFTIYIGLHPSAKVMILIHSAGFIWALGNKI